MNRIQRNLAERGAHPMYILLWVVGGIELDDPINCWDVQPSRCNVGAQECSLALLAKLEESRGSFLLLLTSMYVHAGNINIVEELSMELNRVARAEENHYFLVLVLLQEGEQQQETLIRRHGDVSLFVSLGSRQARITRHLHVHSALVNGCAGQVLNLFRLSCGEEHCLTLLRQYFDYCSQVILEALLQDSLGGTMVCRREPARMMISRVFHTKSTIRTSASSITKASRLRNTKPFVF